MEGVEEIVVVEDEYNIFISIKLFNFFSNISFLFKKEEIKVTHTHICTCSSPWSRFFGNLRKKLKQQNVQFLHTNTGECV